ncbi:hypothetical protein BJY16_001763 [Actinoplanes octamycinicus]|uniref:Uncharacterized protein n=1 Tax=Actinoplanes octamycinicus TaxID=135948 RepID=A0A7W7M601_9ACTN|nr:hypothetical protein [Actinoplanes octamycinicus]
MTAASTSAVGVCVLLDDPVADPKAHRVERRGGRLRLLDLGRFEVVVRPLLPVGVHRPVRQHVIVVRQPGAEPPWRRMFHGRNGGLRVRRPRDDLGAFRQCMVLSDNRRKPVQQILLNRLRRSRCFHLLS